MKFKYDYTKAIPAWLLEVCDVVERSPLNETHYVPSPLPMISREVIVVRPQIRLEWLKDTRELAEDLWSEPPWCHLSSRSAEVHWGGWSPEGEYGADVDRSQ